MAKIGVRYEDRLRSSSRADKAVMMYNRGQPMAEISAALGYADASSALGVIYKRKKSRKAMIAAILAKMKREGKIIAALDEIIA